MTEPADTTTTNQIISTNSTTGQKSVVITIHGDLYDVTHFQHPGEGICNAYIADYRNKDASDEFEKYHYTDPPFEMLHKAKELGKYQEIVYLGKATHKK